MSRAPLTDRLIAARGRLHRVLGVNGELPLRPVAEEGGCGVVGFAASVPVSGRSIFQASIQMHNRGNGKGGGIAAAGFQPEQLGVDRDLLRDDYLLQVALLDPACAEEMEKEFIRPHFRVDHRERVPVLDDHRDVGLEVRPPDVVRYFARVKPESLERFAAENDLGDAGARQLEDEFVYRNSFALNQRYYASLGDKQAFVMSHARDLLIFKIVGYAEQVVKFYRLEDLAAHVWIAHQRYPTKGRVWHPAGAHPFIGLNEALVHNGDFANYYSIARYLKQHGVEPQFLTDTEVSVLLFDLLHRTYGYPLEYVIEALAPTTELDFDSLPPAKRRIYRAIQATHMHGSPDGPWFFIIARSEPDARRFRLVGITDTAMLRPQVFALQSGDATIGLVASEKQAIDAILQTLSRQDPRFRPVADRYWNARGGSHTDGGAFAFTVARDNGTVSLACADKFGKEITCPPGEWRVADWPEELKAKLATGDAAGSLAGFEEALGRLAGLNDRRFDCGKLRRSALLERARRAIDELLASVPDFSVGNEAFARRVDWATRGELRPPAAGEKLLVIDAAGFPPEDEECDARLLVKAYERGWRRFIVFNLRGQRFTGCGLGPDTDDVRIDVFGSSGDYLASGIDGMTIVVHDNAQDQLGQIMKRGTLIVHGDVGQAFMYGAKGGEVYVLGNAAGRPLINAVGRPRVVINGTCLDFLAESFMAGDPLNGGGFVVLNGVAFDDRGRVTELESPYPGANLFSLASGGAIYVRDPHRKLVAEQLNGGMFAALTEADWQLIRPYLEANERHFGISLERDLLSVDGARRPPEEVYRKVRPLTAEMEQEYDVPE